MDDCVDVATKKKMKKKMKKINIDELLIGTQFSDAMKMFYNE